MQSSQTEAKFCRTFCSRTKLFMNRSICEPRTIRPDNIRNGPDNGVRSIYKATGCADNPNHHVIYLEHVVVRITITHPRRGDLAIYLTSPSGTRSQLLANRLFDHSMEGFKNWEFMTTHCWGEKAAGDWILEIYDTPSQLRNVKTPGKLKEWSLVLYGTSIQPYSPRNAFLKAERVRLSPIEDPTEDYGGDDYAGPCNAECSKVGCGGPGPDHCNDCLHYYYKSKNNTRLRIREFGITTEWTGASCSWQGRRLFYGKRGDVLPGLHHEAVKGGARPGLQGVDAPASVSPTVHLVTIVQTRNVAKNAHPTVKHVLEVTVMNAIPVNQVIIFTKSLEVVLPTAQLDFTWIIIGLFAADAVKTVGHALNFKLAQNADMASGKEMIDCT
ncbi:Proprotein convertase subtilisin/kexin type 5 [Varanus komodoensis]|nr:Proprotein convertase subtilisin/kexin type 5 [Varanus komodoensis]